MAHASFLCRNWPPVPWVTNASFYFRHQQVSCTWRWEMHLDQRPTHHHCYLWIPSWSWWLLADGDTTSHGPDSIFQRIVMLRQLVGHCGAGVDFWWVHGDLCSTCWFKPIKSWYVIHITIKAIESDIFWNQPVMFPGPSFGCWSVTSFWKTTPSSSVLHIRATESGAGRWLRSGWTYCRAQCQLTDKTGMFFF